VASSTGITIEEFERLPDALAKNRELVNGELVDVSGNTPSHNRLRDWLVALLIPVVEPAHGIIISEQEFDFSGNAHGPDVALILPAKIHLLIAERRVQLHQHANTVLAGAANDLVDVIHGAQGGIDWLLGIRGEPGQ